VEIFADPAAPEATIQAAVRAAGGTVIEKIPLAGIYLAQVAPGQEASFLSAIYPQGWMLDGAPASSFTVAGEIVAFDKFFEVNSSTQPCSRFHGAHVVSILERSNSRVIQKDTFADAATGFFLGTLYPTVAADLLAEMQVASASGERAVFNLSLQPKISGAVVSSDRSACDDDLCRAIRREQLLFFKTLLQGMEKTINDRPTVADNSVIVVAAGNAGVDLTAQLQTLKQQFPRAFRRVLVVGSSDASNGIVLHDNHSTANMVFARGVNVQAGPDLCSGTSFAAPEVSRVLDLMWSKTPTLSSDKLVDAFHQALAEMGTNNVIPQDANGFTTQAFLDRAVSVALGGPTQGSFSGSGPFANTLNDCTFNVSLSGNIALTLSQVNGTVQGSAHVTGSWSNTVTGGSNCEAGGAPFEYTLPVSGTTSNLFFSGGDFPVIMFQGSQNGTAIIGTATFTYPNTTGSISSAVTLSR
jgi:hypothetical protein